jgi:hypothetical protein
MTEFFGFGVFAPFPANLYIGYIYTDSWSSH